MMFTYELPCRVCLGTSRTNVLNETASACNKIVGSIVSHFIAQSAEKVSLPEVICATEDVLDSENLSAPTKRVETVGPVDEYLLDQYVLNQDMAVKLWRLYEQKTSLSWSP